MSIVNRLLPRSAPMPRAFFRNFHPTVEFTGCLLVLVLAGLTAIISIVNQDLAR